MNSETLANVQEPQRAQDRRTGQAKGKKHKEQKQEKENCNGSCQVVWKPAKAKAS